MTPDDPRHGTYAGYGAGCRNDCCRSAARNYHKARHYDHHRGIPRKVSPVGTHRRLRALAALGWTFADVADRLGCTCQAVHSIHRENTIYLTTRIAIARVYDQLSMSRPEGRYATRARGQAAARGWMPPLAWEGMDIDDPDARPDRGPTIPSDQVDDVAVLRALDGDTSVPLTRTERFEVVTKARALGWTIRDIERRTSITKPERYFTAAGKDAA